MTPAGQKVMQRIYHKQLDSFRQAILGEIEKDRDEVGGRVTSGTARLSSCARAAAARLRRHRHSAD